MARSLSSTLAWPMIPIFRIPHSCNGDLLSENPLWQPPVLFWARWTDFLDRPLLSNRCTLYFLGSRSLCSELQLLGWRLAEWNNTHLQISGASMCYKTEIAKKNIKSAENKFAVMLQASILVAFWLSSPVWLQRWSWDTCVRADTHSSWVSPDCSQLPLSANHLGLLLPTVSAYWPYSPTPGMVY